MNLDEISSLKNRKDYSNIITFVKQILNEMNGQDLLEFLRQREDNSRIRHHRTKSNTVFQHGTLSQKVRQCLFDTVPYCMSRWEILSHKVC